MRVGDFFKSMFTKTSNDNDVNATNLPALQSRKTSNGNGNGNSNSNSNININGSSNGNGTNAKNRVSQNNDMDMDGYNSYNTNNNSIAKYPSTPKTKKGVEDFYVTSEYLPRVTSDNLPALTSDNNTSGFTQPVFDLDSFQDSSELSEPLDSNDSNDKLTCNPSNKTYPTKIEAITEGHILLGKTSNIPDSILDLVTPKIAQGYKVLPVEVVNNELAVLFSDAISRTTAERNIANRLASKKLKYKIKFYQVSWDVLEPAIQHNYLANLGFDKTNLELDHSWASSSSNSNPKTLILDANTKGFDELQNKYKTLFIEAASIAHNARATDLDFDLEEDEKTGQTYLVIRMNVDGSKIPILNKPTIMKEFRKFGVVMRSISGLDTSNDQDATTGLIRGMLVYGTRSSRVELRCNVMPHEDGIMSFSVRIQTPDEFVYTPDNLGMYPEQQQLMDRYFVRSVGGLALFAGPTGSGKNTNQMTFLKERVRLFPDWKTITIEDPIEMRFRGIHQFSVKKDKSYDYFMAAAMRHIPNMIIVGETRDPVTGKLVLEAAESGHFVSTTVHADNCVTAIARMISLNCDIHKLADSLKLIVAQRLVGKTCTKCTKVTDPIMARIPRLKTFIGNLGGNTQMEFLKATGKLADGTQCQNCHGTGVKGRVGIFEIMTFTNEMRDLIINRASGYKIQHLAIKNGMTTLWVNGLRRALTGEVSLSSLERALGFPDPQREGLELDRSMLSDTDSDIDVSGLN